MTPTQLNNLIQTTLEDNSNGGITAADLRNVQDNVLKSIGGFEYFENSNTTPQALTQNDWVELTNDFAGAYYADAKPSYTTTPLALNNRANVSELDAGTVMHIRVHFDVVTAQANNIIKFRGVARNAGGTITNTLDFDDKYFKTSGLHQVTSHVMTFVTPLYAGGTIALEANSDSTGTTILWNSAAIRVTL